MTDGRRELKILALGDSYTIGEGVDADDRWPAQLVRLLRTRGFDVDEPAIIAQTGWTTDELLAAADAARRTEAYDLVTLLVGVNDQYRGGSSVAYRPRVQELLERAVRFAGGDASHVIVLSIPDWSVTPFAEGRDRATIARAIDAFNAVNRASTESGPAAGARYVNVTESSRRAAHDQALLAADGLHPSRIMYAEWAKLVLPAAESILTSRRA